MDHHCRRFIATKHIRAPTHTFAPSAWVNNCVGHHNLAHFYRFLFYVDLACSFHIYIVSKTIYYRAVYTPANEAGDTYTLFIIFNYVACLPVLLVVGIFSIYHFWCLCSNTTTIEGWEKDKAAVLRRKGRIKEIKYPYDLGCMRNIKATMGDKVMFWCWPQTAKGDGMHYEAGRDVSKWLSSSAEEDDLHLASRTMSGRMV